MRRIVSVVLALGVVVAACVWVSAVRFKDDASATDCGTPLSSAQHGRLAPCRAFLHGPGGQSGLFSISEGTSAFVTACRGEARTRLAIAAVAVLVAVGGAVLVNRRPRTGRVAV